MDISGMLKSIVPSNVFLETLCEFEDYPLSPEEELSLGRVVQNRKREFATGRACAHRAIRAMGLTPSPILIGAGREPIWPSGVTGSITHCRGLCAAAVASSDEVRSIGLDAEENLPLPQGVLEVVLSSRDQGLQSEPRNSIVYSDRLLFCVKESVFKAWYNITKLWLDFHECTIEWPPNKRLRCLGGDVLSGDFEAKIDRVYTVGGISRDTFQGRFVINRNHLASLVVVDLDR